MVDVIWGTRTADGCGQVKNDERRMVLHISKDCLKKTMKTEVCAVETAEPLSKDTKIEKVKE